MTPRVIWEGGCNGRVFRVVLRLLQQPPNKDKEPQPPRPGLIVEMSQPDALDTSVWLRCPAEMFGAVLHHVLLLLAQGEDQLLAMPTEPVPVAQIDIGAQGQGGAP